jgi:transcriptional regulator with XRE-family HTH domain
MLAQRHLTMTPLAVDLRPLRHERGWTQQELARRAGVDQPTISRIENGHTRGVGLGTIERLAHALGVSPHRLFRPTLPTARAS